MHYGIDDIRYASSAKKAAPQSDVRTVEIKYITRTDGTYLDHYIAYVGGVRKDGKLWKLSEDEVIRSIENHVSFYITYKHQKLKVVVADNNNHKSLMTIADRELPEKLLSLPDFPERDIA